MKKRVIKGKLLAISICAALLFLTSISVSANDALPPEFLQPVQESQSVCLAFKYGPQRGLSGPHSLERRMASWLWPMLTDFYFDIGEAIGSEQSCLLPDPDCELLHPNCVDCDDDGINECEDWLCHTMYTFVLADLCVPPGDHTYFFTAFSEGYETITRTIRVEEVTWPCVDTDAVCPGAFFVYDNRENDPIEQDDDDDDNDTASDDDDDDNDTAGDDDDDDNTTASDDDDDDDGDGQNDSDDDLVPLDDDDDDDDDDGCGCGVAGTHENPALPLTLLMFAIGLLPLLGKRLLFQNYMRDV